MVYKDVTASLHRFDPSAADQYRKLGEPHISRKRHQNDIESLDLGLDKPTFISLSDTTIRFETDYDDSYASLGEGMVFAAEVALKLKTERIVMLRTKKRSKMRDQSFGEIEITDTAEKYTSLLNDLKFINAKPNVTWFKFATAPTLTITIDKPALTVTFVLRYHYQFLESLYFDHPGEACAYLKSVMLQIARIPKSLDAQVTPKLFYDAITEETRDYPIQIHTPLVPELSSELLRFQGTTVRWMLLRENVYYNDEINSVEESPRFATDRYLTSDPDVKARLNLLSVGFELVEIPSLKQHVWYNKYSGNICTKETARRYLRAEGPPTKGYGLLSEEMGLGKTVELVALTLLNQRPPKELNKMIVNPMNLREIKRAKTTLIVCPESIISQWNDEILLHAPGLKVTIYEGMQKFEKNRTPTQIADRLSEHDIVIASYAVMSREVHNALYNPQRAKRVRRAVAEKRDFADAEANFEIDEEIKDTLKGIYEDVGAVYDLTSSERVDHSSPLVLLEFWRFVLDEVQMVGTTVSNVCTTATLIPRYHSWGASGTPIRNGMSDLNSLLTFMNVHPFGSTKKWKMLLETPRDFVEVFRRFSWRHTKAMVKDDISIPPQQRILLSVPFGPVEQNNYEEMYKLFLGDVGLDEMGAPVFPEWEPSPAVHESMRHWLLTLRRVCCHAAFGKEAMKSSVTGFQTMDKVLATMIETATQECFNLERDILVSQLEIGQIYEHMREPSTALAIWEAILPELEKKLDNLRALKDTSENSSNSYRSFLELLHRCYFFIASAHFQVYTPSILALVPGIEKNFIPEGMDPELFQPSSTEIQEMAKDIVVHRVLDKDEMAHQVMELKYYAKAQSLRRELLAEPIRNVNQSFTKLKDNFQLPISYIESELFRSHDLQAFAARTSAIVNQLNSHAQVVNKWVLELKRLLSIPLLDTVTDPSGDEYEGSLYSQEHVALLLMYLQRSMKDRSTLVNGKTGGVFENYERVQDTGASFDRDFDKKLQDGYPQIIGTDSLRDLVVESRAVLSSCDEPSERHRLSDLVMSLKVVFDSQKKATDAFQNSFRVYNTVYNLKITYFRRLQELSDNVKPFDDVTHHNLDTSNAIQSHMRGIEVRRSKITSISARLRFLQGLTTSAGLDEKDRLCCICRSTITIGSLTACGHRYCKDCLSQWLDNRSTCPICNSHVKLTEVYNFTFNREEINVTFGLENSVAGEEVAKVYDQLDSDLLKKLSEIQLKHDYGSKVNAIVKQVLWLKRRDPYVQVVIFSQWGALLNLIGNSLQQNGILILGSKNSLAKNGGASGKALKMNISLFKKDPNITCFLLNAKADASGLNLVNASHVFLCEPLVQTALELQAISRIHRIGQKRPTTVWTFIIQGSVEESIVLLSARKRLEFKEQLDTEELTKNSKLLVETSGEHVDDADLWNSFFSHKIGRLV